MPWSLLFAMQDNSPLVPPFLASVTSNLRAWRLIRKCLSFFRPAEETLGFYSCRLVNVASAFRVRQAARFQAQVPRPTNSDTFSRCLALAPCAWLSIALIISEQSTMGSAWPMSGMIISLAPKWKLPYPCPPSDERADRPRRVLPGLER